MVVLTIGVFNTYCEVFGEKRGSFVFFCGNFSAIIT